LFAGFAILFSIMKNEMKNENMVLDIEQNSDAESFMCGRLWNRFERKYEEFDKPTFAEIAAKFPEIVEPEGGYPRWGHGHYIEGPDGMPKLCRENYDTSG